MGKRIAQVARTMVTGVRGKSVSAAYVVRIALRETSFRDTTGERRISTVASTARYCASPVERHVDGLWSGMLYGQSNEVGHGEGRVRSIG